MTILLDALRWFVAVWPITLPIVLFALLAAVLARVPGSPYRLLNALSAVDVAMHPSNRYVVATTHLPPLLAVFARDAATGSLEHVPGSPFTPSVGTTPLGVKFDPSGKFAYVLDDTTFSVSAYAFDSTNGHVEFINSYPLGTTPVAAGIVELH